MSWTEEQLAAWQTRGWAVQDACDRILETPRQGGLDIVTHAPGGLVYCRIAGHAPPQPRPRARLTPIGPFAELVRRARAAKKMADLLALFRAQVYSAPRDHPVTAWKKAARQQINTARNLAGFNQPIAPKGRPLEVLILVVGELAKTHHRVRTPGVRRWETSPNAGDWENVAKPVCDAANGILWHDDSQIARGHVEQIVGAQGEPARLEILARPLVELPDRTRFEEIRDALE
jgi:Holliday junction resolvase RusA-like endonuclease